MPFREMSAPPGVMGPVYWRGTKVALARRVGGGVLGEMGRGMGGANGVVVPFGGVSGWMEKGRGVRDSQACSGSGVGGE